MIPHRIHAQDCPNMGPGQQQRDAKAKQALLAHVHRPREYLDRLIEMVRHDLPPIFLTDELKTAINDPAVTKDHLEGMRMLLISLVNHASEDLLRGVLFFVVTSPGFPVQQADLARLLQTPAPGTLLQAGSGKRSSDDIWNDDDHDDDDDYDGGHDSKNRKHGKRKRGRDRDQAGAESEGGGLTLFISDRKGPAHKLDHWKAGEVSCADSIRSSARRHGMFGALWLLRKHAPAETSSPAGQCADFLLKVKAESLRSVVLDLAGTVQPPNISGRHGDVRHMVRTALAREVCVRRRDMYGCCGVSLFVAELGGPLCVTLVAIDCNALTNKQFPALAWACHQGYHGAASLLVAHGADVSKSYSLRGTRATYFPLLDACESGSGDIASMLLDNGADVDQVDHKGTTSLHIACWNGHADVAAILLDRGADVNRTRVRGESSLYLASRRGHVEMVELLLERGADVAQTTEAGVSSLEIANTKGHAQIAAILSRSVA
jgi:hypothetical protein